MYSSQHKISKKNTLKLTKGQVDDNICNIIRHANYKDKIWRTRHSNCDATDVGIYFSCSKETQYRLSSKTFAWALCGHVKLERMESDVRRNAFAYLKAFVVCGVKN